MTTTPTQRPVPSEKPQDLKFNAGKIDEFVTSMGWTYTDRFGNKHYTIEGINYLAQQVMNAFGYITLTGVDFDTGATVSTPNEVLFNPTDNSYYKWSGSFAAGPKVVPENSTPETSGGVGPGKWLNVGDAALRSDLANGGKASLVGYEDQTVELALDDLFTGRDKDGFNKVGRFLNLTELRAFPPKAVGDVVYVVSAASESNEDIHYGGGNFQAVRKASLVDDGGVTIVPESGVLSWVRMDRGEPCLTWFGVRPDSGLDNQPEIEKATSYGKNKKAALRAPAGVIQYSKGVPLYSRSGIIGNGKDKTIFEKTTNNEFSLSPTKSVDAPVLAIPDVFDPDGTDGDSYCILTTLKGVTFRRLNVSNRDNAPDYAFWAQKMAVSIIKDLRFECGNFGFWGENVWSNIFESVQFLGLGIGQYCGFQISKYRTATGYALSGTSNVMNMVQVANYQFGFNIDAMQYTTMTCCTADSIFPMTGTTETIAAAYAFYNPYGITMNSCGAEGVKGSQILIRTANYMDFDSSIVINSFMGCIEQQNPLVTSQVFRVDNTVGKFLSVVFNGGNLLKSTSLGNLTEALITGANTYVRTILTRLDPPNVGGGADYKAL